MVTDVEIILSPDMVRRGQKILSALICAASSAGVRAIVNDSYRKAAPVLMTYGIGHRERRQWVAKHREAGGRVIAWDLGYWDRDVPVAFNMRCTIDDDHPWRLIRPEDPGRFDVQGIRLRDDHDPAGPIVLCGLGPKQRAYKGIPGQTWEIEKLADLRARFPGRTILYRPKRDEPTLPGCPLAVGPIDQVIRGASLVVCAHSNVAVDACIAGVPVECEDGAAFALYRNNLAPSEDERIGFLRSLAWWQWKPHEARHAWKYLLSRLSG